MEIVNLKFDSDFLLGMVTKKIVFTCGFYFRIISVPVKLRQLLLTLLKRRRCSKGFFHFLPP